MDNASCIKCGARRHAGDLECPQCGVIYAKAEEAAARELQRKMEEARAEAEAVAQRLEDEERIQSEPLEDQGTPGRERVEPETKKPSARSTVGISMIIMLVSVLFMAGLFDGNDNKKPEKRSSSKSVTSTPVISLTYAERFVAAINTTAGHVCRAEIKGFLGNTLRLSWTGQTNKLHAIQIISQVGEHKEELYNSGIRYFQIPNDRGTYNQFDWKTGEKKSVSDSAGYYFRD